MLPRGVSAFGSHWAGTTGSWAWFDWSPLAESDFCLRRLLETRVPGLVATPAPRRPAASRVLPGCTSALPPPPLSLWGDPRRPASPQRGLPLRRQPLRRQPLRQAARHVVALGRGRPSGTGGVEGQGPLVGAAGGCGRAPGCAGGGAGAERGAGRWPSGHLCVGSTLGWPRSPRAAQRGKVAGETWKQHAVLPCLLLSPEGRGFQRSLRASFVLSVVVPWPGNGAPQSCFFGVGAGLPASAAPRGAVHAAPSPGPCGLSGESRRGGAGGSASQVCRESRVINCCLPLPPSALVVTAVFDRDVNCRRAASVSLPALLLLSRGWAARTRNPLPPGGRGMGSVRGATAQEWAAPPWDAGLTLPTDSEVGSRFLGVGRGVDASSGA